jgi:site-specific recombinase XerD
MLYGLCDLSQQFIESCAKRGLSAHTARAYQADLADFRKSLLRSTPLSECDAADVQRYIDSLVSNCRLGASTIRRRLACLKATFTWLVRERIITENPVCGIRLELKAPKLIPRNVPTEDLARLLQYVDFSIPIVGPAGDGPDEPSRSTFDKWTSRLALEVLFATGVRVGELEQIDLNDVDLRRGAIRIQGKGARQRTVYMSNDQTTTALREYMRVRPRFAANTERLLINSRGRPLHAASVRTRLKRLCSAAEIKRRVTPHMLRHSAATCLMEASVDIRFVQRFLGHASIVTTQIYTHVSDAALRKAVIEADPRARLLALA